MVHLIEKSHVLDQSTGRLRKLEPTGKAVTDFGTIPAKPAGVPLMPLNVVRAATVPGAIVPAFGSGWITYSYWLNNSGHPVSSFKTTWVVPPAPATNSGQTIFLFNGIQNSTMIYQPVLQWGPSAAGGGNYWTVASWYVDGQNGPAFHSPLVTVSTGTALVGVMLQTGQSGNAFSYNCYFDGIANTSWSITNVQELTWCIETLEAYGITKATDYPATLMTGMKAIELKVGTSQASLHWTRVNAVTDTGQHCEIISNASPGGEVDLYYRNWFIWSNGNMGQGSGAIAWEIGDVNGDGRAEIVQLWNNGGSLGMIVYGWTGAAVTTLYSNGNMGQGAGAIAWLIGDVNGDGRAEIVQLWNNGGSLGMIVYGWTGSAMATLWASGNVGQGSGAIAWKIGDVNGDGRAEIVQLWNNGGNLGMIVYGWTGAAMTTLWGNGNMGQGSGAVAWEIGDVNGDGRAEIVQLWNNGGSLGMIVYRWTGAAVTTLWGNGNMGQGSGAVAWQIGDINGDGRAEIVQLWNNGGNLGMIVYRWTGAAMTTLWGSGNVGQGSGAIAWQTGDVNGDGRAEIVQLWNNGGSLGMIVHGWTGAAMTTLEGSSNVGQGSGAIAWLTGRVQGGVVDEVVQLWNNGGHLGLILYKPV
jgi:hypothetical protein